MNGQKHEWEAEAKDHFVAYLKAQDGRDWIVARQDVVVDDRTGTNFDYELRCGRDFIALEIFRLVENKAELVRQKSWSEITNSIVAELRTRGIKGYTIRCPYFFSIRRRETPDFVSDTVESLEAAIKQNPATDPIEVDGFEVKRIEGFEDVSLYGIGPGGGVNPTGTAHDFVTDKLSRKNEQLNIADRERIILIVNWAFLVDPSNMIEACTLIDFSKFENIDKVYFEVPRTNQIHLVYDRKIYDSFRPDGEPPEQIEPLFLAWLANHLNRKEGQAFRLVQRIAEREKSLLWLPALSREELVSFGEDYLKSGKLEHLNWIVQSLKDDPDPPIENAADDPEGHGNDHSRAKRGERNRFIRSVRGRLCWLLMQIVTHPRIEDYERVFEIIEEFATGENLYVRQMASIPLMEFAKRRFENVDSNTPFMSRELAGRIKALTLRMVDENIDYPAVLESVTHAVDFVRDLDHDTAMSTIKKLLTIDESEAATDISFMTIYFAFYRENHFKQLDQFNSNEIRALLEYNLVNGSDQFRATAANHFKTLLVRNEIEFATLIPFLEAIVTGPSVHVANHHLYGIMERYAAADPQIVGLLIEQLVSRELKSLDLGGREVWHPKEFSDALCVLGQAGASYQERVEKIRSSMEPYLKQRRVVDIGV